MKKVLMGFLLLFSAAAYSQQITVRSEEAEDTDFSKYKTFDWASQIDSELDEGLYFLNDLVLKAQVRDAVKSELMGLGYEQSDENPDLVVNFRVFDEPTKLSPMRESEDYWGTPGYSYMNNDEIDVDAGTLLVSLADKKSGKVVWQGYASGLIDNDQFIKDEVKIAEAVNMIFEDYNERATEYSRR